MTKQKQVIFWVVGICVVIAGLTVAQSLMARDFVIEAEGTITQIDPQAHTATLEFIHPQSKQLKEKTVDIPDDCTFQINGSPTTIVNVRAGDRVTAKVRVNPRKKRFVPLFVEVHRPN